MSEQVYPADIRAQTLSSEPAAEHVETYLHSEPLIGLPTVVSVDGIKIKFGPFMVARRAAIAYCLSVGLPPGSFPRTYAKANKKTAAHIARLYNELQPTPLDPDTQASYRALVNETLAQWRVIKATGLIVEYSRRNNGDPEPYSNPRRLILDVTQNNHLFVNPTREAYGDTCYEPDHSNPLLAEVPGELISGEVPLANDILRIVHDYFGHTREGLGFRSEGEYNAWRGHLAMYSPLARRAMTTEMWAQNCWINYGPFGERNWRANMAETRYAAQKIALLPWWVSEDRSEDGEYSAAKAG
ncbi:hypothetical protein ColLi_00505 [Colletotrichum liriopes]|uniref:Uncharacterized protein n=1 Tax=Colletotrichum liriopes TaxID=708192 RepID=A0AA37LN49_9PEZI|nr:hypothetical protein ColLi_00505 [Colletotrichum liriopes]